MIIFLYHQALSPRCFLRRVSVFEKLIFIFLRGGPKPSRKVCTYSFACRIKSVESIHKPTMNEFSPLVKKMRAPAMLQALRNDSVKDVQTALESDPGAASEPFWDHDVEPPLSCAVRLKCSVAIVRLLLEHGGRQIRPWHCGCLFSWTLV